MSAEAKTSPQEKIGKQIVLPITKAIEISFRSIRIRFWRSLITMGGIILAIGFLTNVTSTRAMTTALEDAGNDQVNTLLQSMGIARSDIADIERRIKTIESKPEISGRDRDTLALLKGRRESLAEDAERERVQRKTRATWLVSMALLVCVVGIANSMLMSVTERFREIGTMKCLGALDRFIVQLFVLESSFQGLVGAGLGATLGVLMSFVVMYSKVYSRLEGGFSMYLPIKAILVSMLVAVGIGTALSVLAAAYPAYKAARMKPVDAMRVDQ